MKVIMRLYRQHDLDLIYLYKLKNFSLQNAVKSAIIAASNGETAPFIDIPVDENRSNSLVLPKQVQFHIYLSEKDDENMIKWILGLTKGYRNSVLKNLVRRYISIPVLVPFTNNTALLFQQPSDAKSVDPSSVKSSSGVKTKKEVDVADEVLHTPVNDVKSDVYSDFRAADEVLLNNDFSKDAEEVLNSDESVIDMFDALFSGYDNF